MLHFVYKSDILRLYTEHQQYSKVFKNYEYKYSFS